MKSCLNVSQNALNVSIKSREIFVKCRLEIFGKLACKKTQNQFLVWWKIFKKFLRFCSANQKFCVTLSNLFRNSGSLQLQSKQIYSNYDFSCFSAEQTSSGSSTTRMLLGVTSVYLCSMLLHLLIVLGRVAILSRKPHWTTAEQIIYVILAASIDLPVLLSSSANFPVLYCSMESFRANLKVALKNVREKALPWYVNELNLWSVDYPFFLLPLNRTYHTCSI